MEIFTGLFQIQKEFTAIFEATSPQQLNKCLQKFFMFIGKKT